LNHIIFLWAFS